MKNSNSNLYIGAALAGIGLYFLLGDANAGPTVPGTVPGTAPGTPPPPVTAPNTPPPPPAPPVTTIPVPVPQYVFVDSYNGEGIYFGVSATSSVLHGYGRERIATLTNGELVGGFTGQRSNGMIKCYMQISGRVYYYWIQESETRIVDAAGMMNLLKSGYREMRTITASLIKGFFYKKEN